MLFWLCVATLGAQNAERKLYSVAFYNLENCLIRFMMQVRMTMSSCPTAVTNGRQSKYESKLQNLSKVLGSLSRDLVPVRSGIHRCGRGGEQPGAGRPREGFEESFIAYHPS